MEKMTRANSVRLAEEVLKLISQGDVEVSLDGSGILWAIVGNHRQQLRTYKTQYLYSGDTRDLFKININQLISKDGKFRYKTNLSKVLYQEINKALHGLSSKELSKEDEEAIFNNKAIVLSLPQGLYNKEVLIHGNRYKVIGLQPRERNKEVIIEDMEGRRYTVGANAII